MRKILGLSRAAIDKYNMIEENDKIAIGISGGKDSISLLYVLSQLRRFYPKKFELIAVTIDPRFNSVEMNTDSVRQICNLFGIEYIVKRTNIGNIVKDKTGFKNPCNLCSRMRKGVMDDIAKKNSCNKVALGHHFDDAVETFFMNLFDSGKIGCFSPVCYLSRKDLYLIRPMIFCEEKDIESFSRRRNLPTEKNTCPVDGLTERQKIKNFVKGQEKLYPDLKPKVLSAMQKINLDGW